jgi:lysyl-tRNA synthetase class 2
MEKDEIYEQRLEKVAAMRRDGVQPYKNKFKRTHTSAQVAEQFDAIAETVDVTVCGRITALRRMGKASFFDITDGFGKVQAYAKKNQVGEEAYELFKTWDMGDIVGVTGKVFRTKTGEITILSEKLEVLTKSLRTLPEKYHGLKDTELRYRRRYLDLIANPEVRDNFRKRILMIRAIRERLQEKDFMEVETPMMQAVPGGALARPFTTHHNALDIDLYMRVAPELYLKRLAVGGFERIFEINRNFRNEGISTRHNPEFTMIEIYQAYADYHDMMDLTEEIVTHAVEFSCGSTKITYQEKDLDFTRPWKRVTWLGAVKENGGPDIDLNADRDTLFALARGLKIDVETKATKTAILEKFFDHFVEPNLVQPTFVYDYPTEISPLARQRDDDPQLTERFEFYAASFELANAFSELTDPVEQLRRFEYQQANRDAGDDEAHAVDHDFVRALEHGLPPTGGLGIGIDRLAMLVTDAASIRDVILFPLLKPKVKQEQDTPE